MAETLFDKLKVEQLTLYKSPVDDGGAALVVKFEQSVELDDDSLAFPLDRDQMGRLFRLVVGWAAEIKLIELQEATRLVKLPHEIQ